MELQINALDQQARMGLHESQIKALDQQARMDLHVIRIRDHVMSIIERLNLPRGAAVLDAGTGRGLFAQRLRDKGFDVCAVDIDPSRFEPQEMECQVLDLHQPFARDLKKRFDLIVAVEVIEHLENPYHFFREALAALQDDGHLLVTTPNPASWASRLKFLGEGHLRWFTEAEYLEYHHISPVTAEQFYRIAQETGFVIDRIEVTDPKLLKHRFLDWSSSPLRRLAKLLLALALRPLMKGWADGENLLVLAHKRNKGPAA